MSIPATARAMKAAGCTPEQIRTVSEALEAKRVRRNVTPQEILERALTPERAEALVEHRRKKRAPLTAHIAGLLLRELCERGDPNENADTMMLRGWTGFRADWVSRIAGRALRTRQEKYEEAMSEVRRDLVFGPDEYREVFE